MADGLFSDARLAALYDAFCEGRPDFAFYLPLVMASKVGTPVDGSIVSFTITFNSPSWDRPQLSRSTLRFLDADSLLLFLADAGLLIQEQYGNWDRSPLTETSPEIITVTRRRE